MVGPLQSVSCPITNYCLNFLIPLVLPTPSSRATPSTRFCPVIGWATKEGLLLLDDQLKKCMYVIHKNYKTPTRTIVKKSQVPVSRLKP